MSKSRTAFQELCYGIPPDLIAVWCGVDIQSARHFKAGTRSPGRSALELFRLHRDGRVLPAEWEGFSFRGGVLWDPYGKQLAQGTLRAHELLIQMAREWARGNTRRTRELDAAMSLSIPALRFERTLPGARRISAEPRTAAAEAKPSALVRRPQPETVRRRHAQSRKKPRRPPLAKPALRATRPSTGGNVDYSMLSPELRDAANAGAER